MFNSIIRRLSSPTAAYAFMGVTAVFATVAVIALAALLYMNANGIIINIQLIPVQ